MSGKTFTGEAKTLNLSNPFKDMHDNGLMPEDVEANETVDIVGMAFEGPLIKKEVVEKIGLPNKELFILYDDTDYSYRTILEGYRVIVVRDALMDKYDFQSQSSYREDKIKINGNLLTTFAIQPILVIDMVKHRSKIFGSNAFHTTYVWCYYIQFLQGAQIFCFRLWLILENDEARHQRRTWKNVNVESLKFFSMKYDYLIVGSGLFGATFAYFAKKLVRNVLLLTNAHS